MRIAIVDVDTLAHNWWAVMLRGVAGILFGGITVLAPHISLAVLVLVFGAYAFADGIFAIASAIQRRGDGGHWWLMPLVGLVGIAAGVLTLLWPGITAIVLLYLIAAWALVVGVLEIATAISLRKAITGEWLLVLSGIAAIIFAVLLAAFPGAGALAVVLWIGAYALVTGVMLFILGLRLRSWGRSHPPHTAASAA